MAPRLYNSDYVEYHRSISTELEATKDRIRHLIGDAHWLTDGEHKEAILRKVIKDRLPETLNVGNGFVCFRGNPSTQIDILITDGNKPVLFKDGDLAVVTPDSVRAIIEVKTKLRSSSDYKTALNKLADVVMNIRRAQSENNCLNSPAQQCWAGLFIYDYEDVNIRGREENHELVPRTTDNILRQISASANGNPLRAINCISVGPELFFRYWPDSSPIADRENPVSSWRSYLFNRECHKALSPAYFIGNLIMAVCDGLYSQAGYFWFPIQEGGGKEQYRLHEIEIGSKKPVRHW